MPIYLMNKKEMNVIKQKYNLDDIPVNEKAKIKIKRKLH